MANKTDILKILLQNRHLLPQAIEIAQRAKDVITEAGALSQEVKNNNNQSLLSSLFSKKKEEKKTTNYDTVINDSNIEYIVSLGESVIEKFELLQIPSVIDLAEFQEKTKNNPINLDTGTFTTKSANSLQEYSSNIVLSKFLGNKNLDLLLNANVGVDGKHVIIDFSIINRKSKESIMESCKKIHFGSAEFVEGKPTEMSIGIQMRENIEIVIVIS